MGTRANIVYKNPEGIYQYTYVHWDGYLHHLGDKLFTYFKEKELNLLFKTQKTITSINTVKRQEEIKINALKEERTLISYNNNLSQTDNLVIGDCFVKCDKVLLPEASGQFKNKQQILDLCSQEFVYLFDESKIWQVCTSGNDKFFDLKKSLKVSSFCKAIDSLEKKITKLTEKQKEYQEINKNLKSVMTHKKENPWLSSMEEAEQLCLATESGYLTRIEKHIETMRKKSFSFMNFYKIQPKESQQYIRSIIASLEDSKFMDKVYQLDKERASFLLSQQLENELIINSSKISKAKI